MRSVFYRGMSAGRRICLSALVAALLATSAAVAADESGVLGFSTFGDFRTWPGYRFTVEHSVHVRSDTRGRGVGKKLVKALFPRAAALGKHVMIAGVDAANEASIRFHEQLGFVKSGHLREVGHKFDRWLDLVFLQRWIVAR